MKNIKIIAIMSVVMALSSINTFSQTCSKEIVGYFYGDDVSILQIDFYKYTKINYAFFVPQSDGTLQPESATNASNYLNSTDPSDVTKLVGAAHAAGCSVYVSIGGAGTNMQNFSSIASSCSSGTGACSVFVARAIGLLSSSSYGFDGIDIDWEFPGYDKDGNELPSPGPSNDKANFTYLLQSLSSSLPSGKKLTITAGNDYYSTEYIDFTSILSPTLSAPVNLEMINMMSYDYFTSPPSGCAEVDHISPMYASSGTDNVVECVTETYKVYSQATSSSWSYTDPDALPSSPPCTTSSQTSGPFNGCGISFSSTKVNLGLPFYGYSWQDAMSLHQIGSSFTSAATTFLPTSAQPPAPEYYDIYNSLSNFTQNWDNTAEVPYLTHAANSTYNYNVIVSYDNERSIGIKANYALTNNFNGVLIWRLQGDYVVNGSGNVLTPLVDKVNAVFGRAVAAMPYVSYNYTINPSTNPLPAYTGRTEYIQAGGSPSSFVSVQTQTTTEVTFTAGTYIELDPGFYAPSGSIFTASINSSMCYENPARKAAQSFNSPQTIATSSSETITIYPNPTSGMVGLNVSYSQQKKDVLVAVYNSVGAEVYSENMGGIAVGHMDIDLSAEPSGLYIVKVKADSDIQYRKVILSH